MNDDKNHARRSLPDDASEPQNGAHPAVELFSEYLDAPADLANVEREAIEQHLTGCEECQATLQELQVLVQTLGTLPEREAPRSFAVTPAMLAPAKTPEAPAPVVLQESPQWHARHADKIRWATAVAALLFVFVISADLVTNGLGGRSSNDEDAALDTVSMRKEADEGEGATTFGFNEEAAEEAQLETTQPPAETSENVPFGSASDANVEEEEAENAPPAQEADEEMPASDDAGAGEDAESDGAAPADESDAALGTSGDAAEEDSGDTEMSTMRIETDEFSDEPVAETTTRGNSSQMIWRVIEVSLVLVLALLLTVMIGLPKTRGARKQ